MSAENNSDNQLSRRDFLKAAAASAAVASLKSSEIYKLHKFLMNDKEGHRSPEQQEILNPFPTFAFNLGDISQFGIKSEADLKDFYQNPESEISKSITSKDEYKKLVAVLNAVGALQQVTNTPDITYKPYVFAGIMDNNLYISGAATGDSFHQLVFYGVEKATVNGKETNLGIVLQVQVGDFSRYIPGMALVRDKDTGIVTYTPFVKDNQKPSESGMINNPLQNEGDNGGNPINPQPTPDPNIFAADSIVFAKYVDGVYSVEGTKKLAAPKVDRWMDENVIKDQIKMMRAQIERSDPNPKYILEAAIPGYNPVLFVADKTTKMQDGHIFTLQSFGFNESYTVDDPDGGRIGPVEALAKRIRQAMGVASNENGMIDVWMASGKKNEYGEIIEKKQISEDAPVILRFGSDRKGKNVYRNGYYPTWNFSYSILDDGSFEIYIDNSFRYQELSQESDWQSGYIVSSLRIAIMSLGSPASDLNSMYKNYLNRAKQKGVQPWIWESHVNNNFQFPYNNAVDGEGDPRLDNIFELQGRVS